jgi:hypothetical protein
MDKEFGKVRKKTKGNGVCKDVRAQELCDRTHQRSSTQEEVERAYVCAEIDHRAIDRSPSANDRTYA